MSISSNQKETFDSASIISKAISFKSNRKIVCVAKKIIFEDHQSDDLDISKEDKLGTIINAFKYIVEEIMELTPEEYDAIYSTNLNQKASISHVIRKIVTSAPAPITRECLFDNKLILFRMCWPDYYKEHYSYPTAMEVFDCKGETKGNLIRAGRPKEYAEDAMEECRILNNGKFSTAKKDRKRAQNWGAEVDKVLYWSMNTILPTVFEMTTKELFTMLANPKATGLKNFGCVKVIEARMCYQSPLDFYFLNSPVDYQRQHFEKYIAARKEAGLKNSKYLDIVCEAYTATENNIDLKEMMEKVI